MLLSAFASAASQLVLPSYGGASLSLEMPTKRSLKLDDQFEENSFTPSKISRKKNITSYSPTTGTCQMGLFSSPTTSKKEEHRNGPSNGKKKQQNHLSLTEKKECRTKDNDDKFLVLLSKIEKSSEEFVEIMQNLSSIQALEGNRELENLIGFSRVPYFLKREVEKTKELMRRVTKQKLFEKKISKLPPKEDIDYLCVVRDLENSIKGVVQRWKLRHREIQYLVPESPKRPGSILWSPVSEPMLLTAAQEVTCECQASPMVEDFISYWYRYNTQTHLEEMHPL